MDYGEIRIEYEQIEGADEIVCRVLKCAQRPYRNTDNGRIKVHHARTHRDMGKVYGLIFPY